MKMACLIVLSSCLFVSCETPPSKQIESGQKRDAELQSSHGTGIWENDTYEDELGQTSDREYIGNKDFIVGSFSTTATARSPLNVRFLIFGPTSISLQLFERGGNSPLKTLTPVSYTVSIEDAGGAQHTLKAMNYSDRVAFEKTDAKTVHDILMKGGKIKFSITDDFTSTSRYQFTIDNASGYGEAYKRLTGK
jgi:hypothetical protein